MASADPQFINWFEQAYNRPYAGEDPAAVLAGFNMQQQQAMAQPDFGKIFVALGTGLLGGLATGLIGSGSTAGDEFLGAGVDPVVAADAAAGTPMFGMEAPFLGAGVDPVTAADAAQGTPMFETGSTRLPISPSTALKGAKLAQGLINQGNQFPNLFGGQGAQMFAQSGTPAGQSYMRKSRPFMDQPAFLGNGQQQALGSDLDQQFNEALSQHGQDVSDRAKQMASALRGRPGIFGFRSG